MATFQRISMDEARALTAASRTQAHHEYREDMRALSPDTAGQIILTADDRPVTIRARLRAAAQAEGVALEIQRKGDTMVFWLKEGGAGG